jgi:hypothetical protein
MGNPPIGTAPGGSLNFFSVLTSSVLSVVVGAGAVVVGAGAVVVVSFAGGRGTGVVVEGPGVAEAAANSFCKSADGNSIEVGLAMSPVKCNAPNLMNFGIKINYKTPKHTIIVS